MKIYVRDNINYIIPKKEVKELNHLYKECFHNYMDIDDFNHVDDPNYPYMMYFILKDNENNIIAFFKIIYMKNSYEIFDVCRKNPTQKQKGLMKQFIKQSLHYFHKKHQTRNKPFILAVRKNNKYYQQACKLYISLGFNVIDNIKTLEYLRTNKREMLHFMLVKT